MIVFILLPCLKIHTKMKLTSIITMFSVLAVLTSCSSTSKLETLKPEPDDASPLVYDSSPSFINLPITVKLRDIENQTNTLLNGLIYEDNNIQDDDIEMKIWKQAPIKIQNDPSNPNKRIRTILPLKANIKYRIGTKKMGIELYDVREFNLNGVITLNSSVGLTNWKLNTKTELKSLDWNESPTMSVFGKNMPIPGKHLVRGTGFVGRRSGRVFTKQLEIFQMHSRRSEPPPPPTPPEPPPAPSRRGIGSRMMIDDDDDDGWGIFVDDDDDYYWVGGDWGEVCGIRRPTTDFRLS